MSHVYGCHNRPPFKDHVEIIPDAWDDDGVTRTSRLKTIPFTMSRQCNYTHTELGQKDPRCQGCKWRVT